MLLANRPLVRFGKLDKCLSKHGKHSECNNDEEIIYSSDISGDDTFIILNGVISLKRGENVLVDIAQVPFIMRLSDDVVKTDTQYGLVTESNCMGYHPPAPRAINVIGECRPWRKAFCWLTRQDSMLELHNLQLIGNNSYDWIRATLISMTRWDGTLRSHIGVMNYVHQRTRTSRPVVVEVLATLHKSGYIETNKGKLMCINRLPFEY